MGMFNDVKLAKKIEGIKIKGTKEYVSKRKEKSPLYAGDYVELDEMGHAFCLDDSVFCVGLGFNEDPSLNDIEMIERFAHEKSIHIELTPYSNQDLLAILQEKCYTLDHFLAVWILDLKQWEPSKARVASDDVAVIKVTPHESYDWARTVANGFSSDGRATEGSIDSAKAFLDLTNSQAFLLRDHEESAAAGFLVIDDQLGEMFLTSTIFSHRGKGYQNLLIEDRIQFAKSKGCTQVTVTTKPNNSSARNMERNGFVLAYNKAVMKSPMLTDLP